MRTRTTCSGCNDPSPAKLPCCVCSKKFHNSCLCYYHTYASGTPPDGTNPVDCKMARVCGVCVCTEGWKKHNAPLHLVPVRWHRYNKMVWTALKRKRDEGVDYVPPNGRPPRGGHVDQNSAAEQVTTQNTEQVATQNSEETAATATQNTEQVVTQNSQEAEATATQSTEQLVTQNPEEEAATATQNTEQVVTQNSEEVDTDEPEPEPATDTESSFEIIVPTLTSVAQRGLAAIRFFGKEPEWHSMIFVAPGVICNSRPRVSLVAGSQFQLKSKDDESTLLRFCVIFPGLWVGYAQGPRSRRTKPRRKTPMRVVVVQDKHLGDTPAELMSHMQVVSANRVKTVFTDIMTHVDPDVTFEMNSTCIELQKKLIDTYKDDVSAWKQIMKLNLRTFQEIKDSEARRVRAEQLRRDRTKKKAQKEKTAVSRGGKKTSSTATTPVQPPPVVMSPPVKRSRLASAPPKTSRTVFSVLSGDEDGAVCCDDNMFATLPIKSTNKSDPCPTPSQNPFNNNVTNEYVTTSKPKPHPFRAQNLPNHTCFQNPISNRSNTNQILLTHSNSSPNVLNRNQNHNQFIHDSNVFASHNPQCNLPPFNPASGNPTLTNLLMYNMMQQNQQLQYNAFESRQSLKLQQQQTSNMMMMMMMQNCGRM